MEFSHFPVHIPDADYDRVVGDESTSSVLQDKVFDNPLYDKGHLTNNADYEVHDNDVHQQSNYDNHTAYDVHASQSEDTVIVNYQAEATVNNVQFNYDEESSGDSKMDEQEIESVDVISSNHAIDVERQDFSSARSKDDIAAEARRIREKELTICFSMFVVVVVCVVLGLVIFFAVSETKKAASSTTETPLTSAHFPDQPSNCSIIVTRDEWGARRVVETEPLPIPTPYLVVHHTDTNECNTSSDCANVVRGIQNYHMDTNGWWDIGYNFLIGGDGYVYEGRGWDIKGSHAREYNQYSIGVAMIGQYADKLPTNLMLDTLDRFIDCLKGRSKLDPCYTLYGHRQAGATKCPGEQFYSYLQGYPHWRFTNGSRGNPNPLTPCDR